MNYIYRVISFLVLAVLFIGCGSYDKNDENKPKTNIKKHSSSQSCFADTRSIFKNINAPVFTSVSSVDIYEGKKNVSTIVATPKNGGTISYLICGRGSMLFDIDSSNGKIIFKDVTTSHAGASYDFIVKATDSKDAKSTSQIFTINILGTVAPKIEDIGGDQIFTLDSPITPIEFVNTGGAIATCSVTPPLSNGLRVSLLSDNCVLSGTPNTSGSAEYNITASNTSGDDNATIKITTSQSAPNISDTMRSSIFPGQRVGLSYIQGLSSEPWVFTNTGGTITKCDINKTIPDGLVLGSNCTITGTPTNAGLDSYTITGSNSEDKNDTLEIQIQIKQNGLSIDNISDNTELIVGQEMTPIQFGTGDDNPTDKILYCAISPVLPSGLILSVNSVNRKCEITGTPSQIKNSAEYTVRATSALRGGSATVTIVVNAPLLAPDIADAVDKTFTSGTAITSFNFTNSGGAIASCAIDTPLSAGLSFNTTTCEISGTPTSGAVDETTYTITATNATGDNNATVKITVNAALLAPDIATSQTTILVAANRSMSIIFTNSGGDIDNCIISPALPSGLDINGTTCHISGTTSVPKDPEDYTITATNTAGNDEVTMSIAITVDID